MPSSFRRVHSTALGPLVFSAIVGAACSSPTSQSPGPPSTVAGGSGGGSGGVAGANIAPEGGTTTTGGNRANEAGSPMTSAGASGGGAGGSSAGGAAASGGAAMSGAAGSAPLADECGASPPGDVVFSVPSGAFEGSLNIELRTNLAGAEIRYTTDHTEPTASSPLYPGTPLTVSVTTRLMARTFAQGEAVGPVQTAIYVARAFDQPHDLPVIVLDTYGTPIPGQDSGGGKATDEYVNAAFLTFEPNAGMTSFGAPPKV
ncbi:MAG TPA: chitobiase/beta-hexosaminidase C-terminal domain-containing protein, partial [Polyangiaceae bacterium]